MASKPVTIAIVGSGLAGLSAALEAVATAGTDGSLSVVVLEKEDSLGGNSNRASSGISAYTPESGDTPELFTSDTSTSGGNLSDPALMKTVMKKSAEAIKFLEAQGADLSHLTRLGGHSVKRTHSNPQGPHFGTAVMAHIFSKVNATKEITVITNAKVEGLKLKDGRVCGVEYTDTSPSGQDEPKELVADAVILASGGYGAGREALRKFCPSLADFATTNGHFAQGDGHFIGQAAGARLVHMDQVQLHPTGFIDPKFPEAQTKMLAPEFLRGYGGILLNLDGKRFVNELLAPNLVAEAILAQKGQQAYLVLGEAAQTLFGPEKLGFYCSKDLIDPVEGVDGLATDMELNLHLLIDEIEEYNEAVRKGGPDKFGKDVFPNEIDVDGPMCVMRVTPAIHYTMGGLSISENAEVLNEEGSPIPGLYAAGEVTGGLHGVNRLAGNSLMDCVVFGRLAGAGAVRYAGVSSSEP